MNGNESAGTGTTPGPPERLVYRFPEAGQILGGISRNSVKSLVRDGELETVPIGHFDMVTRESIVAYIERGKRKASERTEAPAA